MDMISGEITLRDLLAWEPRLELAASSDAAADVPDPLDREVEWVVTARATAPMLPSLRGGELVILPQRLAHETGIPFPRLIHELMVQPIAGLVTDAPIPGMTASPFTILTLPRIGPETESELNRLLATRRRELLEAASDVDRIIADAVQRHARPGEMIHELAGRLHVPLSIVDDTGAVLFATGDGGSVTPVALRRAPDWQRASLKANQTLWIGPITSDLRALIRITRMRIHAGLQRLLDRDASAAPHGTARSAALNALLLPDAGTQRTMLIDLAFQSGISPGRTMHVALVSPATPENVLRRVLASYGDIHDAGLVDGCHAFITVASPSMREPVPSAIDSPGWIAVSSSATTARVLPDVARQARYLAILMTHGLLREQVLDFTDHARLGVYRLLYEHWGSATLDRFRSSLLQSLYDADRHGTLQQTLRIFLEEGGSLRPTAERLGIHRNTLTYRVRQLRSLVDADLDDPHMRISLHLALIADRLPQAPD